MSRVSIEEMSLEEFQAFRSKFLRDNEFLSESALAQIRKVCDLDETGLLKLDCKKNHRHTYPCFLYTIPTRGIIDVLINEVYRYKSELERVNGSQKVGESMKMNPPSE
jgi:hypothetical protein